LLYKRLPTIQTTIQPR